MKFFIESKSGALQMSFAWIFAIIAGAFILFLAIFAVTKFTGIESTARSAETSRSIGVLLNPLETSFESGRTTYFSLPTESRIYATCSESGKFGTQKIRTTQEVYGKWSETDLEVSFINKYIFGKQPVEGKDFAIFSKPFNLPFKVADLIYMTSLNDNYCFINAPGNIEEEISLWNLENLHFEDCPENSIDVCFSSGGNCDVFVNYDAKSISKTSETYYFNNDALMYAGIFSKKDLYECQVKRLMKRARQLSFLYSDKATFLQQQAGCDASIKVDLVNLENLATNYEDSFNLRAINNFAENVQNENEFGGCKLW